MDNYDASCDDTDEEVWAVKSRKRRRTDCADIEVNVLRYPNCAIRRITELNSAMLIV